MIILFYSALWCNCYIQNMSWTHTKISCCGYLRVESAKLVSCANICPTTGVTSCIWSKTQKLFRLQTCQFPQDVFLQGLRLLYCFSRHTFFHNFYIKIHCFATRFEPTTLGWEGGVLDHQCSCECALGSIEALSCPHLLHVIYGNLKNTRLYFISHT